MNRGEEYERNVTLCPHHKPTRLLRNRDDLPELEFNNTDHSLGLKRPTLRLHSHSFPAVH